MMMNKRKPSAYSETVFDGEDVNTNHSVITGPVSVDCRWFASSYLSLDAITEQLSSESSRLMGILASY